MDPGRLERRVRYWLRHGRRAASLRDEMQFHLEMKVEQLMEAGMSAEDARSAARRQFGNVTQKCEESRTTWIARWFGDLVQDVAFAARTFRKQPGFTALAVLSAALGIGACTTIFGIANFALFRPLPVDQPARLMSISRSSKSAPGGGQTFSFPDIEDLRKARSFSGIAAFFPVLAATISAHGEPQRNWGSIVTANYFEVVRSRFVLGRGFDTARDDKPGEAPVIVLSDHIWRTRFASDPRIVGKIIEVNKLPTMVLGVAASEFRGTELALVSEFWVPFSMIHDFDLLRIGGDALANRKIQWVFAAGRLRDGATAREAIAEAGVIAKRLALQYPKSNKDRAFHIETAGQVNAGMRSLVVVFFSLLLAVTALVLLTACANVANLLLARAAARHKEIATRLAIGAGRGRIVRQLLTESVLLALLGGAGGFLIAEWGASSIGKFRMPVSLPVDFSISLDYRVLLFSIALSVLTGMIFGLVPALRATKADLVGALKDEPARVGGLRRLGLRNILVIAQVAVSMLLLISSGLFLRSLYSSQNMNTGMANRNALLLSFDPPLNRYNDVQSRQVMNSILDHARTLPGVESASLTDYVPLSLIGDTESFIPDNKENKVENEIDADIYRVAPGFFETLGIHFNQGEDFRPGIGQNKDAVIVNQALADRAFPGQNPMGRSVAFGEATLRIAGVAATAKSRTIGEDPHLCLYRPVLDVFTSESDFTGVTLLLRTRGDPASYVTAARDMIHRADPALAVFDVHTLQTHFDNALLLPRLAALLFGICGFMGLLISTVGIYGVVSFAVARRTREIGIRMALGARRTQVVGMVLRQGLALTAVGCSIGVVLALLVSRVAESVLYGISPSDPLTFVLTPLFLGLVTLAACIIPARRAAALDPMNTVRHE
jgi:predicted permease